VAIAMSDPAPVAISVVIPAYRDLDALPRALSALREQRTAAPFEVLVVVSGADGSELGLHAHLPGVRTVVRSERLFPGQARNLGALEACGEVLLFLDADCALAPDGIERATALHRRHPDALVGAAIEPEPTDNPVAWAHYFCSLTGWMPQSGADTVPVREVAGGCCSVRRETFRRVGPFPGLRYNEDTLLSWQMARAGVDVLFAPGLRVRHLGPQWVGELVPRKLRHGRAFGRLRAGEGHWSVLRRALHLLGTPLVPGLLLARSARAVWHDRRYRREFLRVWPLTLAGFAAWAVGEAWGLLAPGSGESTATAGD
jgi:GT2 family glycosyltransferase